MQRKELAQMVAQRVGISESQAEQAVDVILSQLKSRLPAPISSQLDNFLGGEAGGAGGAGGAMGDIAKGLGGMMGR